MSEHLYYYSNLFFDRALIRWDPDDRVCVTFDREENADLGLQSLVCIPRDTKIALLYHLEDVYTCTDVNSVRPNSVRIREHVYADTVGSPQPAFGAYCNSIRQFRRGRVHPKTPSMQKRRTNARIARTHKDLMVIKSITGIRPGHFIYVDYGFK